MSRLTDLAGLIGKGPTITAVTLAAYLVGSMLVIRRWPLSDSAEPPVDVQRWLLNRLESRERHIGLVEPDPELQLNDTMIAQLSALMKSRSSRHQTNFYVARILLTRLGQDFDTLATKLLIERESLWNEYDRLRAEAELRFSIAIPISISMLALTTYSSEWFLLGFLAPIAFWFQGVLTQKRADRAVWSALIRGLILSPGVEVFMAKTELPRGLIDNVTSIDTARKPAESATADETGNQSGQPSDA